MTQKEIYQFIEGTVFQPGGRYDKKDFTLLKSPVSLKKLVKDKSFVVQVHDISPIQCGNETMNVGFAGAFLWAGGQVHSLDGDTYNEGMKVYAYSEFDLDGELEKEYGCKKGLDVLVTEW